MKNLFHDFSFFQNYTMKQSIYLQAIYFMFSNQKGNFIAYGS